MLVVVQTPAQRTGRGRPVKSSRERMEILNAFAAVGSYRGAAALCGTTHKTVKRVLERLEAGELEQRRDQRVALDVAAQVFDDALSTQDPRLHRNRL